MPHIDTRKKECRKQVLQARALLTPQEHAERSEKAARQLLMLPELAEAKHIMLFYPFRDEIDTRSLLEKWRAQGRQVWLPLTIPSEHLIIPYVYDGEHTLRTGAYGISEPDPERAAPADLSLLDAVIVPGVAFDQTGGRLGYGGGYYDRFFEKIENRVHRIGYGFSVQITENVPAEPHDRRMHLIVTDQDVWRTATFPS
ncbi:5-formyltetrahydrofolate cyclo-ligase [Brevibacillus dissolubilis]|uniref:5-formyltetrahydrofolate cyclo-ligase n=1 Tax=Brevibacillus dissolubilis TaxID=1844116 RepID=UPI0011162DD1|nr:5-formyltetrahydrofolate cyclo-ligase [Brevibacillus dissolubilis]